MRSRLKNPLVMLGALAVAVGVTYWIGRSSTPDGDPESVARALAPQVLPASDQRVGEPVSDGREPSSTTARDRFDAVRRELLARFEQDAAPADTASAQRTEEGIEQGFAHFLPSATITAQCRTRVCLIRMSGLQAVDQQRSHDLLRWMMSAATQGCAFGLTGVDPQDWTQLGYFQCDHAAYPDPAAAEWRLR